MSDAMHPLLAATPLLDVYHPDIEALVARRGWRALPSYDRIGAVYDFVRNEIAFGYNEGDELPASSVLADSTGSPSTSPCRRARSPGWPTGWRRSASFTGQIQT